MRILFLSHRLPYPPDRGGRIRAFHVLRHLGRTHEVTLAAPLRSRQEAAHEAALRALCARTIVAPVSELASGCRALLRLPTQEPSSMGYFHSPKLAAAVHAELDRRRYDLICVHCSSMAPYVAGVTGVPKLLDFGDMDSQKWLAYAARRRFPLSLGYAIEGWKLQRAEADLLARFELACCTTEAELETLRRLGQARRSGWFANGVDGDYFRPPEGPYEPDTLCFLGRMDYYPNRECMMHFCAEILPRLRQRRPGVKLRIVGGGGPRSLRRLARHPGVEVTGAVDDVRPHVERAALSVAPLRIARGTQNKILESLAMGIPVVSSPLAARGVDAIPGEHLLAADGREQWVEAIVRVLESPSERRRLPLAGRARVLSKHTWEGAMRQLDGLIEECMDVWQHRPAEIDYRLDAPGRA